MSDPTTSDPAVVEREREPVLGIDEGVLHTRIMHIAGIDGRAETRILSRARSGSTSRLVNLPAGWGTDEPGAFTAAIELFVIKGSLSVDGAELGRYGFTGWPPGAAVGSIRTEHGAVALMFTAAPLRFDHDAVEPDAVPMAPVTAYDVAWEPGAAPGVLTKTLAQATPTGWRTRLIGAMQARGERTAWAVHDSPEECFVLEGAMEMGESLSEREHVFSYRAGGYLYRPAGVGHGGPRARVERYALLFHRSAPAATTTWFDEPTPYPAHLAESPKRRRGR